MTLQYPAVCTMKGNLLQKQRTDPCYAYTVILV